MPSLIGMRIGRVGRNVGRAGKKSGRVGKSWDKLVRKLGRIDKQHMAS